MKLRLLEGGPGWTAQFHRQPRLSQRANIRHRSQRQLATGREQAVVLLAYNKIDILARKTPEAGDRELKRVRRARDDIESIPGIHGLQSWVAGLRAAEFFLNN